MKLISVQYLRVVAALLVVWSHSITYLHGIGSQFSVRVGALGVALFFVISGFIMVYITGKGSFKRSEFYLRRMLRVVPLYWLATIVVAGASLVMPAFFRNTEFSVRQLIYSLLFIPHYRPNGEITPLLKLGWTLNLEMFFYLCFGVFSKWKAYQRVVLLVIMFLAMATCGIIVKFENAVLVQYTQFDLVSFCIGMLAGALSLRVNSIIKPLNIKLAWLVVSVISINIAFFIKPDSMISPGVTFFQALASGSILLCGIESERSIKKSCVLAILGDASYSIYLSHMFVLGAIFATMDKFFYFLPDLAQMSIAFCAACLGGVVVHFFVERPIIRLGRLFI